jgi:hypothetical protein
MILPRGDSTPVLRGRSGAAMLGADGCAGASGRVDPGGRAAAREQPAAIAAGERRAP